ncbi:MAG TPA: pyruvate kinase [Bacteroidales bacterium]|nr:pyruvate kinase [Bacteroidales bacterium]
MIEIFNSKTKIIATLGPATSNREILRKMIIAGLDVFRLNFSHGDYEEKVRIISLIRSIEEELNVCVAILADLQGPKIRLGMLPANGIKLETGSEVVFSTSQDSSDSFFINYDKFAVNTKLGDLILIDDGKIKLKVTETNKKDIVKAKVIVGGVAHSRKGVNLPDTIIELPSLTDKDLNDMQFIVNNDIDWVALSFVRSSEDIINLKKLIRNNNADLNIIAKIEKPEAVKNIDSIISETDGIMIARGDLGVEVDFCQVPTIQKNIITKCISAAKPVIIATQMLESMIQNFAPTRAEANDVANAVLDGADTLMLSGETSVGAYPVESIEAMERIIEYTEANNTIYHRNQKPGVFSEDYLPDSVCYNASLMAEQTKAKAIVTFTYSGYTAFRLSSHRPKAEIYAFTGNDKLLRKLPLIWGVIKTFHIPNFDNIDKAINYSIEVLKSKKVLKTGDLVVHIGSTPILARDRTNMIKLTIVD